MARIAIIGSGIAGMASAWFLHKKHAITVFEQNDYIGGHTNTAFIENQDKRLPIDTGFIVCNRENYPLLMRLFSLMDVPLTETSMGFSVQHLRDKLEYAGNSLNHLFCQRKNLLSPRYFRFLMQVNKFNKICPAVLDDTSLQKLSIQEYVKLQRLGTDFLEWYIIPMCAALWSTPQETSGQFPVLSLVRFLKNHGLLGLHTQHQWYTVQGGSEVYKQKLISAFQHHINVQSKVESIRVNDRAVDVFLQNGSQEVFDKVVIATHADQALAILQQPSLLEQTLLSQFTYQKNETVLHTDESLMPKKRMAWSSWNYRIEGSDARRGICTYWMNSLQRIDDRKNYFVTLNGSDCIDAQTVLRKFDYEHPVFTTAAMKAQEQLPELNKNGKLFFCGSYFRNGFHEDALRSAVDACQVLLDEDPWS